MRGIQNLLLYFLLIFYSSGLNAQADSSAVIISDTVIIESFQGKQLLRTAAAINYISSADIGRFNNANVLQALNATPGVRMEERSPGSYRLNIRGSSVRSPFGVRNVKIYYDYIPFTAPGGSSMLNMLGYYNIGSVEIIKGPAGSMYGAGTGGAMLIQPLPFRNEKVSVGLMAGSYGLFGANASLTFKKNVIRYERLQADGYRNHSAMQRNNFSWTGLLRNSSRTALKAHFIYSNLFYETPGALNMNEFSANPRAARPSTAAFPGAEQARASIDQDNILLGLSNTYIFNRGLKNITAVYASFNQIRNPTVQNYERKNEPHVGGRTLFEQQIRKGLSIFDLSGGLEYQQGMYRYKTYKNVGGKPDSLRVQDEQDIQQLMGFAQINWNYKSWILSAGGSINHVNLDFNRLSSIPPVAENKKFGGEFIPRFSLLYRINLNVSAFINVAKGFSPPAADEIFADNNSYNLALAAEKGWNYEPGIRGSILNDRLGFDISYFSTGLRNSIVTRRDSGGGNYYINAGKTKQQGFEMSLRYKLSNQPSAALYGSSVKTTYSRYRFRYAVFEQAGNDYSGNTMPGVSPNNLNLLIDLQTKKEYYLNLTYSFTDKVELNDANSASAGAFHLLSAKIGKQWQLKKIKLSCFAGADNIGDVKYSLGNDINGFGGRYFNLAAGRSFYTGLGIVL